MFLSKLMLNPRSRQVRREIAEPYEMHRTLSRAFQSRAGRVLFRVDTSRETGALMLLVQSPEAPDWAYLHETRDYLVVPPDHKEFHASFRAGQRFYFRLRANPTMKKDGKRLGLLTEDDQRAWLDRKARTGGFSVCLAQVVCEGIAYGRKTDEDGRHSMSHLAVRYDGVLEVTDPERLLETLGTGIGSGKGLGFGLLSLKRVE